MKKLITAIIALALIGTPVLATTTWNFNVNTKTVSDFFGGQMKTGIVHYSVDNRDIDPYYGFEVTKVGKEASINGKGHIYGSTEYKCPKVSGTAKYGKVISTNYIEINGSSSTGYYRENYNANYIHLQKSGNYFDYGYGTELSASGKYALGTGMNETIGRGHSSFFYAMEGKGSGKIRYGSAVYNSGPNWGDKHGSMHLSRWEYNDASATGKGTFEEHLYGKDSLSNYKYNLPGGGSVDTVVTFNDGMDATPIWMYGK